MSAPHYHTVNKWLGKFATHRTAFGELQHPQLAELWPVAAEHVAAAGRELSAAWEIIRRAEYVK